MKAAYMDKAIEELAKSIRVTPSPCTYRPTEQTANLCQVSYTQTITITCKFCGSKEVVKNGVRGQIQYYLCRHCGRAFAGNNALPGMRFPPDQITASIGLFYDGLSIDAVRRQLDNIYHVYPSDSTVYEWIIRFTKVAVKEAKITDVKVGDIWIADETVLKLDEGKNIWFWDVIDDKTRFLLASYMSVNRMTKDAEELMLKAFRTAGHPPKTVITDKLKPYLSGIKLAFGDYPLHKQGGPFNIENNTNLIERFHGTLKARTKVMRGLHNKETARLIMDGWLIHYNFFRPHEVLENKTPGEVAKATFKYKEWKDVVMAGGL